MTVGKFPEQLVYVRTNDDIVDAGVNFTPAQDSAKAIAVISIRGWEVIFYQPIYVAIGRALADRGYTTVVGNTRMQLAAVQRLCDTDPAVPSNKGAGSEATATKTATGENGAAAEEQPRIN